MINRIPSKESPRWTGPYIGNYYGNLWKTFNIDLENNIGHITLSKSFVNIADTSDTNLLNLENVDAFIRTNADNVDRYWAMVRNGRLMKTYSDSALNLEGTTWDQDTLASSPFDARDMTIHENDSDSSNGENILMVTRDTDINVLNDTANNAWTNNWWITTKGQTALKSSEPHPIEYFPFQRITLIGDGNLIHTIDKNKACTYARLVLPTNLQAWAIFTTAYRAWICCGGKNGKNGAVIEWDGFSQTYNNIWDVNSSNALTGVDYNGIAIVVNNRGLFLEYNGNGFSPMIRNGQIICFPSYGEIENSFEMPSLSGGTRAIGPRGMTVSDDGLIYINALQPSIASIRQTAGVWCLNPLTGSLYHKYSLGLGGTSDYGLQNFRSTGAIKALNPASTSGNSYLIAGGRTNSSYGDGDKSFIWALHRSYSSTVRRGYFITQFISSDEIQEQWSNIWTELSAFRSTSDRIIVKAKGTNSLLNASRLPLDKTITWTSTTTFTVTLAGSDDALAVGDEIEVLAGKNAGVLAHITTITGAHSALQTITIDETVASDSLTSLCRFERWKKLGVIDNITKYVVPLNVPITSSFIHFKLELRGPAKDFDIKSLTVSSTKQTISKK
jgi:hypothetical protein